MPGKWIVFMIVSVAALGSCSAAESVAAKKRPAGSASSALIIKKPQTPQLIDDEPLAQQMRQKRRLDKAALLRELDKLDKNNEQAKTEEVNPPVPAARNLSDAEKEQLLDCVTSAQGFYRENKYQESEAKFRDCLKIQPADEASRISLAGVLMVEEKLEDAEREFKLSLKILEPRSPMAAYCMSRLGDILLKLGKLDPAAEYYIRALELEPRDGNSQIGLARYYELQKEWPQAAAAYRQGLELEPSNPIARDGLRRVEPYVMSPTEILTELKERKAVPPEKTALSDDERELFAQIRDAEQMGAVDYLKKKLKKLPPQYVLERNPKEGAYRLMLTFNGFRAYRIAISKAAVKLFESRGIPTRDVFQLRCMNGKQLFDVSAGMLSYDGMQAYYAALIGEKQYLLPNESTRSEAAAMVIEHDQRVEALKKEGYAELSQPEYDWLKSYTQCSEATFEQDLDMRILRLPGQPARYFVDTTGFKKDRGVLISYVTNYRTGKIENTPQKSTAFFGGAAAEIKKLCTADGKLWN